MSLTAAEGAEVAEDQAGEPDLGAPDPFAPDKADAPDGADESGAAAEAPHTVKLPAQTLTTPILQGVLLAEIALARGQPDIAAQTYHQLAQMTRDPRVARRATELALRTRQNALASDDARIWLDTASSADDALAATQALTSLLASVGRNDELLQLLNRALANAGDQIGAALMRLPPILARIKDKALAWRITAQATQPYLQQPEARLVRAAFASDAHETVVALDEINAALKLKPDWQQAALMRAQIEAQAPENHSRIIGDLNDFVAHNPQAHEARLALARALIGAKRYEEALMQFKALQKAAPDNLDHAFAVALLYLQLNRTQEAEAELDALKQRDPGSAPRAELYLGQASEQRHDDQAALKHYQAVPAADENYTTAQGRVFALLVKAKRFDEALTTLSAVQLGGEAKKRFVLACVDLLRSADQDALALAALEQALLSAPDDTDLLYEAALLDDKLNRVAEAERRLRRVIKLKPDNAHAYNALGYTLADRNERLDEAGKLIDRALELRPDDPFILDSKGWLLYRKGDKPAALTYLRRALGNKNDPEIAAHLGEVLWQSGEREAAKKAWADAAKAFPDNAALSAAIKRHNGP